MGYSSGVYGDVASFFGPRPRWRSNPLRVVLVEGYDDLREVLAMTLSYAGFDVRAFSAAHEAFAAAARDAPHVVIVGSDPPELGDELGRRLQGDVQTSRVARVAVTSSHESVGALESHFHRVFVKPVDTERLVDEVERLVFGASLG
jgi:two-component system, NtrC family, C4-dicarboxylate transport response regulator DctD